MCNKVKYRIACEKCGYPWSEALYPDNWDNPLPCDATDRELEIHIEEIHRLRDTKA